jgi:hypothetical protein
MGYHIIIIENQTHKYVFYHEIVRHLWVILIIRMAMKPLGGGDFELATPPATNNKPPPRRT